MSRLNVSSKLALGALLCASLFAGSLAHAQDSGIPLGRFGIQRFSPAPGAGNYLSVDGARLSGHLNPSVGLTFDYAHRPFVLYDAECDESGENCSVGNVAAEFSSWMMQANLYGALVLFDRLQIGLNLPFLINSGDGFSSVVRERPISIPGGTQFALGDPTLSVKMRFLGEGAEGFFLAGQIFGTFPVGHAMQENGFFGDESVRLGGRLIAEIIQSGFHLSVNLGGFWRPESTFFSTRQASQITYAAAIGYDVTPLVMIFAEIDGAAQFSSELDEHPLEARLAGRIRVGDFSISLFGGGGIVAGVGVPVFRAGAGIAYSRSVGDADGDGILDADDACPSEPEDVDGWLDDDGCPDPDNDGDGLLDADDQCPIEAEDIDGFEDEDGCPDNDNDGDGVADGYDSCPNDPEDMDGDRDDDGCPDNDTDQDGIPDHLDACPEVAEDMDGFGDEDGCPEEDFDGDTIPDDQDECPDQPEMFNGINDTDGCPEADSDGDGIADEADRCPSEAETLNGERDDDGCPDGTALVTLLEGEIQLHRELAFTGRGANFARPTVPLVRALIALMRLHPELLQVQIQARGQSSDARAQKVMEALVSGGIDQARVTVGSLDAGEPANLVTVAVTQRLGQAP